MHVSKLEGSWNETGSDFKLRFPSSTDLFTNQMMPKDSLTIASDMDLKLAVTVSRSGKQQLRTNKSASLETRLEAKTTMTLQQ